MEPSTLLERFYLENCRTIFKKFLEEKISSCDVTLVGDDGTRFKCHQFVLSACSPFFERALANYSKTKRSSSSENIELVILLASYKTRNVQRMVEYIYNGRLADIIDQVRVTRYDLFINFLVNVSLGYQRRFYSFSKRVKNIWLV